MGRDVLLTIVTACALAGCGAGEPVAQGAETTPQGSASAPAGGLTPDSIFRVEAQEGRSVDLSTLPAGVFGESGRAPEVLTAQVLLDRARFSPGVIDGRMGENLRQALTAYEKANGLPVDGQLDDRVLARLRGVDRGGVLREYTITEADVRGPFVSTVPDGMAAQAKLERLSYTGPAELLAEKFHMDADFLRALNPGASFAAAGTTIRVVDRGKDELGAKVARVEVDKGEKAVRAYAADGRLLGFYPATIGSAALQSPSGETAVNAVAPRPKYYFDPSSRSWGPDRKVTIAAGPNNPVGSVWIDLEKDGYGLHGTTEPADIGKTASHGCVRLTNWDAEELAGGVSPGVPVVFLEA